MRRRVLLMVLIAASACGGGSSNPNNPSPGPNPGSGGTNNSNCFVVVGNKGTISASISGLAAFSGIVGDGMTNRVVGGPVPVFTVGALNIQDGTGVIITGQAVFGTSPIGLSTNGTDAVSNSVQVQTRSCSAGIGSWAANNALGSGTITVTSASSTGVAGSFSATLEPGAGALGTKTISGTFSATY